MKVTLGSNGSGQHYWMGVSKYHSISTYRTPLSRRIFVSLRCDVRTTPKCCTFFSLLQNSGARNVSTAGLHQFIQECIIALLRVTHHARPCVGYKGRRRHFDQRLYSLTLHYALQPCFSSFYPTHDRWHSYSYYAPLGTFRVIPSATQVRVTLL